MVLPCNESIVDIYEEETITLNRLAQEADVNPSTVWRWWMKGVRGVKLETFVIGGRRKSSRQAYRRFVEQCTAAANGTSPTVRTPAQRERDIARAEAELAKMGV